MQAAERPVHRPPDARLMVVEADGSLCHRPRRRLVDSLESGDLLVANDAATLPASLHGLHTRGLHTRGPHAQTGSEIEVRLAARRSLAFDDVCDWTAVVFGAGDYRIMTENRPAPPALFPGDILLLGPLEATVRRRLDHPRLVALSFAGTAEQIWAGIASHGRPIQYAHVPEPLALWDAWTPIAARPVALEPPSASFALDWSMLPRLAAHGVEFATLTHAAGISSTGSAELDARLPLDEPYELPLRTVRSIARTRARGGRIVALGTTVTRALEHAGQTGLRPGPGVANQRIGHNTRLRIVDAILSGTHEPGESHYDLLRAFTSDSVLGRMSEELEYRRYRNHEFGDSVLVHRSLENSQRIPRPRGLG